jgi:hypothetical protein
MVDFPSLDPTTRRLPDVVRAQIAADLKDNTQVEGTAISQLLSGVSAKPTAGWASTDLATAVQTSLGKADSALQSVTLPTADTLTGVTAVGKAVMKATDAPTARTALGAGTSSVVIGTATGQAADAAATTTALNAVSQDVIYTGTGWPASNPAAGARRFISVGYPSAAAPVGLALGDLWFRDKAAV